MLTVDQFMYVANRSIEKACDGLRCSNCPFSDSGNRECNNVSETRQISIYEASKVLYNKYNLVKKIEELL